MTERLDLEAVKRRHAAGDKDDQHDGWTVRHGWKAHTDRAALISEVEALREALAKVLRIEWAEVPEGEDELIDPCGFVGIASEGFNDALGQCQQIARDVLPETEVEK